MRPCEAVLLFLARRTFEIVGPRTHAAIFAGAHVVAQENAEVAAAVGDVRVSRLRRDERALSVRNGQPQIRRYRTVTRRRRAARRSLVLLRAVNVIRKIVVERDVIELPRGLVVLRTPGLAAVGGDSRAAVVSFKQN